MNIKSWLMSRMSSRYRANWFYRRGMIRAKLHNNEAAFADYTAVIEMANVPQSIRAMALYNRALVHYATANQAEAINDLEKVLQMPDTSEHVKTEARRKLVRMERFLHRTEALEPFGASHSQGGKHARIESKAAGKHTD